MELPVDIDYMVAMRRSAIWYASQIWPEKYDLPFGAVHYEMDRQIANNRATIILMESFRGSAKTSMMKASASQGLHWGDAPYTVWVGPSKGHANKSVRFIVDMMQRPNAVRMFGDPRKESTKWSIDEYYHFKNTVQFGKKKHSYDSYLESLGAGQPLQGSNLGSNRIHRAILDDIEDPSETWSDEMVAKYLEWFDTTLFYALHDYKTSKIFVLGTNARRDGFIGQLSRRPGVYTIKFPCMAYTDELAQKFGVGFDESLWPERYPTELLKQWRKTQPGFAEQMLMLPDDRESIYRIPMDRVTIFQSLDTCPPPSSDLTLCFTVDTAKKATKDADKSAIVVGLWDKGKDLYVIEGIQGKWGTLGTMDKLFEMVALWSEVFQGVEIKLGVESDTWDVIETFFRDRRYKFEAKYPGIRMSLTELKTKSVAKTDRIMGMIPLVEAGRVKIYEPRCEQLLGRLYAFRGKAVRKGDDLEDAWAYQRDLGMSGVVERAPDPAEDPNKMPFWKRNGWTLQEKKRIGRIGGLTFNHLSRL